MIVYVLTQSVPGNLQSVPQARLWCLQVFATLASAETKLSLVGYIVTV